jgi:hypothetical protein
MSAPSERNPGIGPEREMPNERLLFEIMETERAPVRPEIIKASEITIIEADETEWLPVTNSVTADEYATFHKDFDYLDYLVRNQRYQEIWYETLEDVCRDKYSSPERSRTFIAFTEKAGLVGQVRVGIGKAEDPQPIEAMNLFETKGGWPHEKDNIPNDKICEIGRVVVSPGQRPENTLVILKSLLSKAFDYGREHGSVQGYTIKPTKHPNPNAEIGKLAPLHARFVEIGIEPELVTNAVLKEHHPLADLYEGYFKRLEPKVFHWRTLPSLAA